MRTDCMLVSCTFDYAQYLILEYDNYDNYDNDDDDDDYDDDDDRRRCSNW